MISGSRDSVSLVFSYVQEAHFMSIGKKYRAAATRVPPEILLEILAATTHRDLQSTSLVHPTWRTPSQYLLHADLSLPSRKIAKSFLQVEGRKCYSRKLLLPISLDTEDCWEVLEGVDGLEHLVLVAQEGATGKSKFEVELLEASTLAGLKTLRLTAPFSEPVHPSTAFTFPFRLSTLSFKGTFASYPTALLECLVDSCATSITSLDLDVYGSAADASRFFDALLPIAPRLKHIEIHGSDRISSRHPLLVFLTGCSHLESFKCWEASQTLLASLSPTVSTLEICKTYIFHNDLLYDTLLTQSGVLDYVKLIKWSGISRASLKAQRGGNELLGDLEEKGIATRFGAETRGHWYGLGLRS
ncbi:hypothetical protein JCM16303_005684 [Sporobolomyces ruberrimus]